MPNAIVKSAVERLVGSAPVSRFGRRRRRGRVLVLAYHNIVPDRAVPAGDPSLHLPLARFQAQISRLAETHRLVSLADALAPAAGSRPRAVITFDDAYRGAILLGLPELARRGIPATVFVAPGMVGREAFWWDRFAPDGGWDAGVREDLLTRCRGAESEIIDRTRTLAAPERVLSEWHRVASEPELAEAARLEGVTLGSHTWDHPNLAALGEEEIDAQLTRSMQWLASRFDRVLPWVAYPYGLHSPRVHRAAERCGLAGGLAVTGGWWPPAPVDRFALPRWNVPAGISLAGFEIRAAGYWCR